MRTTTLATLIVMAAASSASAQVIPKEHRAAFRKFVNDQHLRSFSDSYGLQIGRVIAASGITFSEVPARFGAKGYRYAIINDRIAIVEPSTSRVVGIIP